MDSPSSVSEDTKPSSSSSQISFYMTGFGPFGGVKENPTTTIIHRLKKQQQHIKKKHNIELLEVVKVSASSATEQVRKIGSHIIRKNLHNNSSENDTDKTRHFVIIHFGVNHNLNLKRKPMFQLEQHAYNEANFRIPDEDQFQPRKQPIIIDANNTTETKTDTKYLSSRLSTDLNVKRMKDFLLQKNNNDDNNYEVGLSGDAGRFVCNYIYYQSLSNASELQKELQKHDNKSEVHVLFVHVPGFESIPEDTQVKFSLDLLDAIEDALVAKDKKKLKKKKKKKESQTDKVD